MATYRAAVVGLGRMGSTYDDDHTQGGATFSPYCHGPAYYYSPQVELVAGADPHDEQRELFGERWGISPDHLYRSHKDMLANEDLDIVSVTTTAKVRASIVQDAARAGVKGIWAEKPIAISLEEADAMVRVCRENNIAFAVNTARRWNPFYTEARRMIEDGELGEIYQVTAYGQCGLSHNGSHLIDIMRYLAGGNVEWVFGEMESDEAAAGDNDLMGNGYMAFDNGVRAYIRAMPVGAAGHEVDVIGERGRIRCNESPMEFEITRMMHEDTPGSGRAGARRARPRLVKHPMNWPINIPGTGLTIVEDIINAFETGGKPKASGDDGLAALEIAMALRESHRRGGVKVTLPLQDRSLLIQSSETLQGDEPARIRRQKQAAG